MCMQENWSVRTLRERKKSMLYERTAISKKPEETIKNEIAELRDDGKMSLDLFYRDPYMLDFLGLRDTYSEKDLENAILAELEKFILEMGSDFAFLARQKHFVLDGKDYYMDLLFYHRGLKRLVLVELKLGEFEPQDKGQVELYLRWLEKNERVEGEESPVALILCAEKSQETIELMQLDHGNIHVGQYMTKMPNSLNNYTIVPLHMFEPFSVEELQNTDVEMVKDFGFTKGIPVMKIPASGATSPNNSCYQYEEHMKYGDLLFDLKNDPDQNIIRILFILNSITV